MSLPIPKYRIGDVVYYPSIESASETLPCPDCLGERKWRAISPAGTEHTLDCPRCTDRYAYSGALDKLPSLVLQKYAPQVRKLTIGAITAKTMPWSGHDPIEYMANETGIGSGSIYEERKLFPDFESAMSVAEAQAALKNSEIDAKREVINARHFSGLKLNDAALERLCDGIFEAWQAFRSLGYQIESFLPENPDHDTDDQRQLREDFDRYGRYAGTYLPVDHNIVDALLLAQTPEEVAVAGSALKQAMGLPDKSEPLPCTCAHANKYLHSSTCPRHGANVDDIV